MDYSKIGKFIAERRKKINLTQKQLGEKLNVTDKAVSKWERGLGCPDISLLGELSEILEVGIGEILNGEYIEELKDNSEFVKKAINYSKQITENNIYEKIRKILYLILIIIVVFISFVGIKQFAYINGEYSYKISKNDIVYAEFERYKENIKEINKLDIDNFYISILDDLILEIDNLNILDLNNIKIKKYELNFIVRIINYINDLNNIFVDLLIKVDNDNSKYYNNFYSYQHIKYDNDSVIWNNKIYFYDMYSYEKIYKNIVIKDYYEIMENGIKRLNNTLEILMEVGDKNE